MKTSEYIAKIQNENYLLAIAKLTKFEGDTVEDCLTNAKLKYEQRPFDGAWEDIKVMIEVIETNLNK